MDPKIEAFVRDHPDTAMITASSRGTAHAARIEIAVVDGHLWSSGSPELVRTRNLRRDPRCTLFVFAAPPDPRFLTLETTVDLLDGPDSPEQHVRLMQARHQGVAPPGQVLAHDDDLEQDRLYDVDDYLEHVRDTHRLIYQFEIDRAYGNH